ncbi:methyltransferase family protein [Anaerobacillus sp. MEB173]|uniref:methyltransferase family protein n=1 Tax=Anaerobacillus sp. MEB173 TaxID=3383345 RepID=UPI003F8EDDA2
MTFWILEFVLFKDQQRKEEHSQKDVSLLFIQASIIISVSVSYLFALKFQWGPNLLIKEFGLFSMASGIIFRYWSYSLMKQYYTRSIHSVKVRPLLSHGPYRITRHPFQTGLFLIVIGLSLFISVNWLVLTIVFPVMGAALHYRMNLEEQHLKEIYQDIYIGWRRHRV